jgi:hypothetical protein
MAKSTGGTQYLVMILLNYLHAPVVRVCFLGAAGYAILQRAKPISLKRRVVAMKLSLALLIGFIAEVLHYLTRALADAAYKTPHYAAIRCLGAILVWIPLSSSLTRGNHLVWYPYFGAFVAQFLFEAVICLLRGFTLPPDNRYSRIPLAISAARGIASLLLVLDGFVILVQKHSEESTEDEEQSRGTDSRSALHGEATRAFARLLIFCILPPHFLSFSQYRVSFPQRYHVAVCHIVCLSVITSLGG